MHTIVPVLFSLIHTISVNSILWMFSSIRESVIHSIVPALCIASHSTPFLPFLPSPDPQPDDHFQYYGFGRYARELNELTPELKKVLPPSDTRYRPDQR